jgi:hypothetical protein
MRAPLPTPLTRPTRGQNWTQILAAAGIPDTPGYAETAAATLAARQGLQTSDNPGTVLQAEAKQYRTKQTTSRRKPAKR